MSWDCTTHMPGKSNTQTHVYIYIYTYIVAMPMHRTHPWIMATSTSSVILAGVRTIFTFAPCLQFLPIDCSIFLSDRAQGRGQETFGEDPTLTAELAVAKARVLRRHTSLRRSTALITSTIFPRKLTDNQESPKPVELKRKPLYNYNCVSWE